MNENYLISKLLENPKLIDMYYAPELSYFSIDDNETHRLNRDLQYLKKNGMNDEVVEKAVKIRLKSAMMKSGAMKE